MLKLPLGFWSGSVSVQDGYECQCCPGYVGPHCEERDGCYPSPCRNSGICVDISQGHEGSTYQCLCPYGKLHVPWEVQYSAHLFSFTVKLINQPTQPKPNQTKPNPTQPNPTQPTNQPTSWEFNSPQLVKKFNTCYGTWRFITVFIRARHWSLSWARWVQSTISRHFASKIHSNIILPSTPRSS
jgi:hypothetical protein